MLWKYKSTPGVQRLASPKVWPSRSSVHPKRGLASVVMLAHPHCDCTRASLAELNKIMPHLANKAQVFILFARPKDTPESWTATDLWKSASAISGVTVVRDDNGAEATLFGASTSGHTLLYSAEGELLFSGGITGARGHTGDNPGEARLMALINGKKTDRTEAPVFGCHLQDPSDAPLQGYDR
jgi:hypothetical protein